MANHPYGGFENGMKDISKLMNDKDFPMNVVSQFYGQSMGEHPFVRFLNEPEFQAMMNEDKQKESISANPQRQAPPNTFPQQSFPGNPFWNQFRSADGQFDFNKVSSSIDQLNKMVGQVHPLIKQMGPLMESFNKMFY